MLFRLQNECSQFSLPVAGWELPGTDCAHHFPITQCHPINSSKSAVVRVFIYIVQTAIEIGLFFSRQPFVYTPWPIEFVLNISQMSQLSVLTVQICFQKQKNNNEV